MVPNEDRCAMGGPLGEEFRCLNRANGDALWCAECQTGIDGGLTSCMCAGCSRPYNEATATSTTTPDSGDF